MASQRGMTLRNEAANHRIDAALTGLVAESAIALPDHPTPSRDAFLNATQRLEWIADVLETIRDAEPVTDAKPAPKAEPKPKAKAARDDAA